MPEEGGGVGQFVDLRGAWQEREGGVFEDGVDTLMHTMSSFGLVHSSFATFALSKILHR